MSDIAQHQILFLDDDADFLQAASELFGVMSEHTWRIQSATAPDRALEILDAEKIDLVVVDVNMPVIDGVQFVGVLQRRHPALKRAVLTAFATEEKRAASLANGADLFIEKPHSSEGYNAVFAVLGELLQWTPRTGFQGVLRRVGLQDVIQMECLARNSSILEVYNEHVLGRIYIQEGQLIHAVGGDLTGEKALQRLLSLPGGSFELAQFEPPDRKTLSGPWEVLLMDAARILDETAFAKGTDDSGVDPQTLALPSQASASNLEETLVCARTGETLFDAACADATERANWLQAIEQEAEQLGQILPLGSFDRLETELARGRIIALSRAGRLVFVRVSTALGNV